MSHIAEKKKNKASQFTEEPYAIIQVTRQLKLYYSSDFCQCNSIPAKNIYCKHNTTKNHPLSLGFCPKGLLNWRLICKEVTRWANCHCQSVHWSADGAIIVLKISSTFQRSNFKLQQYSNLKCNSQIMPSNWIFSQIYYHNNFININSEPDELLFHDNTN